MDAPHSLRGTLLCSNVHAICLELCFKVALPALLWASENEAALPGVQDVLIARVLMQK